MISSRVTSVRFVIGTTTTGLPTWWLFDERNHMLAWAGRSFPDRAGAREAAVAFKEDASRIRFTCDRLLGGWWQWRAWSHGSLVATSAENFVHEGTAQRSADSLRHDLGTAAEPEIELFDPSWSD